MTLGVAIRLEAKVKFAGICWVAWVPRKSLEIFHPYVPNSEWNWIWAFDCEWKTRGKFAGIVYWVQGVQEGLWRSETCGPYLEWTWIKIPFWKLLADTMPAMTLLASSVICSWESKEDFNPIDAKHFSQKLPTVAQQICISLSEKCLVWFDKT